MRAQIYKRKNTYWVRYTYNSKQHRESLKTSDANVARRVAKQIEKELLLDIHEVPNEKTTIDSFLEKYFVYAESHQRPKTVKIDRWAIKELLERVNIRFLQDLTHAKIEGLKHSLKESGLSANSINVHLQNLSSIFGVAVKWELLQKNPFQGIKKYKTEKNPPRYLSKEQIETILGIAKTNGRSIYFVFLLGIYAGMRRNEIANARWEWFDYDQKTITISSYNDFHLKDHECLTIPMHKRIEE